jgi:ribonuclease D
LTTPGKPPHKKFRSEISREEIMELPLARCKSEITLVRTASEAGRALASLRKEKVLGFDTETRAAFKKGESYPPSLVQLAGTGTAYIFMLSSLKKLGGLEKILSSSRIVKTGVALGRDVKELREIKEFVPAGFVELEKVSDERQIAANGLRGLTAIVLGRRISKGAQRSNWARPQLSDRMIQYAATDAWACREIYLRLTED